VLRPRCYAANYLEQQSDDHSSAYWKSRDLIARAQGSTVPLFMTQGFIENNTKPDGAYKASAPFSVPAATIAAATDPSFALPGALGACS
jgi:predicted acyl esterase